MSKLIVEGGHRLEGRIAVEGNKNAALPLLAACLLTDEECVLHNVPRIRDVAVMAELLEGLGARVEGVGTPTLRVRCAGIRTDEPDPALVGRLRGSVLLLGPLLALRGRASLAAPGGDFPSRRTISTHLRALQALGVQEAPPGSSRRGLEVPGRLKGAPIYLEEASVTATETVLLAAARAEGLTSIRHAASEPHVVELCRLLRSMGAGISGEGTATIRVEGSQRLRGAEHRLNGDYIEAGSWAVAVALTRGALEVEGVRFEDMEPISTVLDQLGVRCSMDGERFRVEPSKLIAAGRITTGVWPGFPSDMVSLVTVLATQAEGTTLIHDWMYELRLFALEQLSGMGADLFLCDPHRIIVNGPKRLRGRSLDSRDLRSGMAVISAALAADGESRISPLETVERGYALLVERLQALGAKVSRED
jgi:UDP-N-acetylglucosamine 1-carboxyvinyltransferase